MHYYYHTNYKMKDRQLKIHNKTSKTYTLLIVYLVQTHYYTYKMLNYKANKKLCNNLMSNSQTKKHILSHIDFSILKKSVKWKIKEKSI